MSVRDEAGRARAALDHALRPAPDDDEHPDYEMLEAFVDRRLDADAVQRVTQHTEGCARCAEDLADLGEVQLDLHTVAGDAAALAGAGRARRTGMRVGVALAAAATLVLAIWGATRPRPDERTASRVAGQQAAATAPRAIAPEVAAPLALTAEEQTIVARVVAAGRLELPPGAGALRGQAGMLLGRPELTPAFGPDQPVGTAVASARPRFSWRPHPDARSYTVAVFDEGFVEMAQGVGVAGTSWTPALDLPRGATYLWQVTAHLPGGDISAPAPPAPEARLRVLDASAAASAAQMQVRLADRPLELGVLLARAGLFADARRELERAPAPGPALARELR